MNTNVIRQELRAVENLAQNESYTEALNRLENMTAEDLQDQALIWTTRAYVHSRMGENEAAILDLNRSIDIFSMEPHPYYTRGIIHFQKCNFINAINDFSKVIELCDYYKSIYYKESAYFLRADAYVRLREFDKAIADCAHVSEGFQTWSDKLRTKEDILAECEG